MKLSIITINFNNLEGLKQTVDSILSQTYRLFEYIIIDGASTDGSKEYLKANSNKFTYWLSEPDTGIYNAMNKGIKIAKGDYLLFLNSGDYLIQENILYDAEKHLTGEDIIYFDLEFQEPNRKFIKSYPKYLSFEFFKGESLPHPSTFIKKNIILQNKSFREDFKIVSDWAFFINAIFLLGASYKYVPNVLSNFNTNGLSSLASNQSLIFSERKKHLNSIRYLMFLKKLNTYFFKSIFRIIYK